MNTYTINPLMHMSQNGQIHFKNLAAKKGLVRGLSGKDETVTFLLKNAFAVHVAVGVGRGIQ